MTQAPLQFDGATFDLARDGERLTKLLDRVRVFMSDRQWHTLPEKSDFGGWNVDREYVENGLWKYRVTP